MAGYALGSKPPCALMPRSPIRNCKCLIHLKIAKWIEEHRDFMAKAFRIITLAGLLIGVSPDDASKPFGVATIPAPDDALTTIWRGLQSAMRADEQIVVTCRDDPACGSPAALQFIAIVDEAKSYEGRALVGHINRAVNLAITATHHEVPWMSPLKALTEPGDCKSYAVAKYAALGDAGIAPDDRRLVIVWDRAHPDETHLVVAVRVEQQWLILDNMTSVLTESTSKPTYEPLHTLDETGVRDFPVMPVS
jgi:predicted transglutaminase-like cysteine proteinase